MKKVESVIKENIVNQKAYFVFPTDIAASSWADYALELGTGAISLERFMAWDQFKSHSIRSEHQDKNAIPSTLRKFFALNILEKNKKECFFNNIINKDYVHTSSSFTDYFSKLLPQLQTWYETVGNVVLDEEDKDLLLLRNEYKNFLDEQKLFDPAWERPPFHTDGNIYYIIYPEILQDFSEYKDILENAKNIELISMDELLEEIPVFEYTNTRSELRETALYIRDICSPTALEGEELAFSDVAISIFNTDTLVPYICRELEIYNIPYKVRSGKNLSEYPAGKLFSLIQNCYTENFSFEAVKSLILDNAFPWDDPLSADQLIDFGIKNNCLCSYDNKDIWELAFSKSFGEKRAENYYGKLKKIITTIATATSFKALREHYMNFRNSFFNLETISYEADIILSRMIVELSSLIDLEESYPNATICNNYLSFFVEQLSSKDYVIQSKENGVHIFKYGLASSAPYKQHIILDASQNAITVAHKKLSFLRDDKRKKLSIEDENKSLNFIHLYALHSHNSVRFSCSTKTFDGFSIAFNALKKIEIKTAYENGDGFDKRDLFSSEKKAFLYENIHLEKLHSIQKEGFSKWIIKDPEEKRKDQDLITVLHNKITERYTQNNKIRVSATSLKSFYTCPMQWLFTNIIQVKDSNLDATLIDDVFIGNFYHEILKRYLTILQTERKALWVNDDKKIAPELQNTIVKIVKEVLRDFPYSCPDIKKILSDLTIDMFKMQEQSYITTISNFITSFTRLFVGSRVIALEKELSIEKENYILHGVIDCILDFPGNDTTEEGIFIVDFKTGSMPSRKLCIKTDEQELKDFQLPLYTLLCEHEYCDNEPLVVGASFVSINKKNASPLYGCLKNGSQWVPRTKTDRLSRMGKNEEGCSFEPTIIALTKAIEDYVESLTDKNLSIFTNPSKWTQFPDGTAIPFETCCSCDYRQICRTTYTNGDK